MALAAESGMRVSRSEVFDGLQELLTLNWARVYRLSSTESPKEVSAMAADAETSDLYFGITDQGLAVQMFEDTEWHFRADGSLRKCWSPPID
jgi:hypothetical protein